MESKTNKTKRKYGFKNKAFFWSLNAKTSNDYGHSPSEAEDEKFDKRP